MNWHAVHTKPNREQVTALSLQRLGVDTFCPRLKQTKLIRRQRQPVTSCLFPGYLFARFNIATSYRAVNYARGVRQVVAIGGGPAIVDDGIIASIRSRMSDGYVTVQPRPLVPGQTVRILEGPFQGLEAIFELELSDEQRITLLLQALSYKARIVIDREYVERVHRSADLVPC